MRDEPQLANHVQRIVAEGGVDPDGDAPEVEGAYEFEAVECPVYCSSWYS